MQGHFKGAVQSHNCQTKTKKTKTKQKNTAEKDSFFIILH